MNRYFHGHFQPIISEHVGYAWDIEVCHFIVEISTSCDIFMYHITWKSPLTHVDKIDMTVEYSDWPLTVEYSDWLWLTWTFFSLVFSQFYCILAIPVGYISFYSKCDCLFRTASGLSLLVKMERGIVGTIQRSWSPKWTRLATRPLNLFCRLAYHIIFTKCIAGSNTDEFVHLCKYRRSLPISSSYISENCIHWRN